MSSLLITNNNSVKDMAKFNEKKVAKQPTEVNYMVRRLSSWKTKRNL